MLLLALCAQVRADVFGPISLVSDDALEQADYAHDPAISGNGEYVAFDGYFAGLTGVWRRDVKTGAVEPVAVGEGGTPAGSAELPSISENGQYVSFTTTAALSPKNDTNVAPDVYVRDMEVPESEPCAEEESIDPAQPCAFTLVSAVSGSTQGLSYEYSGESREYDERHYGALAAGRSAMSANGGEVVFVTTTSSNLAGEETPELEVAVRYLQTGKTELVSVEYDPATGKPAVGPEPVLVRGNVGAVYSPGAPLTFELPQPYALTRQVPASISADGSTVAWLGQDVGEQAPTLPAESLESKYAEPLWRRIADGEEAPIRRVTGGSDPTNQACVASGETSLPSTHSVSDPCQGPFLTTTAFGAWTNGAQVESPVPRLSADGYTVAFIAQAPLVAFGSDFDVAPESRHGDLYVADMHEGLSRTQALTPITELASGNEEVLATNAPIVDFGISPDGSQVAFATIRTQFILGSFAYVNAPAAVPGMLELFDVDLADGTLTRVTHGYEGGPSAAPKEEVTSKEDQYVEFGPADGALSPSFSDSGGLLAFSSDASNLVFGDGNTPPLPHRELVTSDGSDVFLVKREAFPFDPAPQVISEVPPAPSLSIPWSLGVTALSLADGGVRLYIEAPGAGALRAVASSSVAVRSAGSAQKARGARGKAKGSRTRAAVVTRDVATATHTGAGGLTTLTLTLPAGYRSLAARAGGLSATVNITFTAPGHPTLHKSIAVSFLLRKAKAHRESTRHTAGGGKPR
jgi:hypothetical protein